MTGERLLVWAVAVAVTVVAVLGYVAPPTPPAQLIIAVLGVIVVAPLAFVFARLLYSFRSERRGWR
ncbi:MAG: quinol-cytochrome oxidoreductase complex cytochrome b subunit [Natronomonas sp.]|jgi:quinol-cytochrome oxidoreductase complex cytochrome b subunit|uniref:hypothetical protein n=1 Tax=Natronomonas sp. TaxID=2184060 RepID=UPI003989A929